MPSIRTSYLRRKQSRLRQLHSLAPIALLTVALLPGAGLLAQQGVVPTTAPVEQSVFSSTVGNFFDNTRGNLVRHQLGHISPIAIDQAGGAYLFAPNNAGQRVSITYLPTDTMIGEIFTGPGITSLKSRPTTVEGWATDSINGCVSVIDPFTLRIMRTIPVSKEPHGIAFLADGSRAYVTCSADAKVDVIDCATYSVVQSITIPGVAPRGIAIAGNTVWVASFYSGNNTAAKREALSFAIAGPASSQSIVEPGPASGDTALPDGDLFAITITASAATDFLDANQTVSGVGTILFNLHAHPTKSELWIPNTDALNRIVGEASFTDGQVVSNRISIVDPTTSAITVLDLETLAANAGLPNSAQPVAVEFDTVNDLAFVAAFGSDAVLVIDTSATNPSGYTLVDRHLLTPLTPPMPPGGSTPAPVPSRCGPRGLVLLPGGDELVVFNGIDNSYSRVDLTASGSTAPTAMTLGFDPTPAAVKRGLGHLANADHSATGTSSCFSCHVDGHFDMLMWDLSAFTDTAPLGGKPQLEIDNKGPMATQSLRGLAQAGPLHWRGERAQLTDFNVGGFVGLLKRSAPLTVEEFDEVEAGTNSLVYPSNPRQQPSRVFTSTEAIGLDKFRNQLAVGGFSCASCHRLPLGTSCELQPLLTSGGPAASAKVAHLRGVGDKLSPSVPVFTSSGYTSPDFVNRTTNGWGLTHAGSIDSLFNFVDQFPGVNGSNPSSDFRTEIAAFAEAFDTGLAPSTAWQQTLQPGPNALVDWTNALNSTVIPQRNAGNCDFVIAGTVQLSTGYFGFSLAWDHQVGAWQTGINGVVFSDNDVFQYTLNSGLPVTVFGMPLGTGWRFGVDRDLDGLLNDSEGAYTPFKASDVWTPDSDMDGIPDGLETPYGLDPRVNQGLSSPDNVAPTIVGGPIVVFTTHSTCKIEFTTNEPARVEIVNGVAGTPSPADGRYDVNHSIYVRELVEGATTNVDVILVDAIGNGTPVASPISIPVTTDLIGDGSHVTGLQIVTFASPTITVRATVESYLVPTFNMAGHEVHLFAYADAPGVAFEKLTPLPYGVAGTVVSGTTVDFQLTVPPSVLAAAPGTRRIHYGVRLILPGSATSAKPYIEGKDVLSFRVQTF
ncbi:MAG: hypothetical protein H6835_09215 [Planctomycetes bacterium]|nr:hypothetical protein [Planctomycetota bacterium]